MKYSLASYLISDYCIAEEKTSPQVSSYFRLFVKLGNIIVFISIIISGWGSVTD